MSSSSTPPNYPNPATDPRSLTDAELLEAVNAHQPLALTEAYHRTVSAAHAVVRRLLNDSDKIEEVLTRVYSRLWAERPTEVPLEGWARAAAWDIGTEVLRRDQLAPVAPSVSDQLSDLPAADSRFVDTAERAINELPDAQRTALLNTHDRGIATVEQEDPRAGEQLVKALVALAGSDTPVDGDIVRSHPGLADWAMGTASPTTVATIEQAIEDDQALAELSRTLRRGRRRIEGLPATPDMGARILVSILAVTAAPVPAAPSSAPDPALGASLVEDAPVGDEAPALVPEVEDAPTALHVVDADANDTAFDADGQVMPTLTVVSDLDAEEPVAAHDGDTALEDVPVIGADDEDDSLEGGLLADDPFGDEPVQDWVPQSTDTSEMRLRDVIEGAIDDDEDPFGDEDASPYDDEMMPRTAVSGRIADQPLEAYDDTYVRADQTVMDYDDQNAATTQFQAIGQGSEDTLYNDPDTPYEQSGNPIMNVLGPLLENQAIREWVLPLVVGALIGLLIGYLRYG